jgi:hypothetical protein
VIARLVGAALLLAALALFATSSAAAPPHPDPSAQPVAARAAAATPSPTVEELCTEQLWEWIGPYWELGDDAAPPGLEARYRNCMRPWAMGAWYTG